MSDPMSHPLVQAMQREHADVEFVSTDDLGDHYVEWVERTTRDGGPAGIWFYIDQINARVVVERIGAPASST